MPAQKKVEIWYSIQSDYCYFLIDRLLLLTSHNVEVVIRPVLGLVLRMPEATQNRSLLEQEYFLTDTQRTAEYLGLPHSYPTPSPIQFEPRSLWIATKEQPRIEQLYQLFIGANRAGKGLQFLDIIIRGLWDGSQKDWDTSSFLPDSMVEMDLDYDKTITGNTWSDTRNELTQNHEAMLNIGHWGVPLMAYDGEPFYGQDRFDQLLWRMGIQLNG